MKRNKTPKLSIIFSLLKLAIILKTFIYSLKTPKTRACANLGTQYWSPHICDRRKRNAINHFSFSLIPKKSAQIFLGKSIFFGTQFYVFFCYFFLTQSSSSYLFCSAAPLLSPNSSLFLPICCISFGKTSASSMCANFWTKKKLNKIKLSGSLRWASEKKGGR